MKPGNHLSTIFAMLLISFTFLGGCATTGMDRSVKTTNSIHEVDAEIRKMIVHVDDTGSSLDALVSPGNPDLKKSFDSYTDNVTRLDKEGKKLLARIEEMKLRSYEYFAEWEKQGDTFTNPDIRALSMDRRNKLAQIYAHVPTAASGIKGAYFDYLTDLKEIQMYLSNDLTPKGIAAITPVAQKSTRDGDVLKESIKPVLAAMDEIKAELYDSKK